MLRADWSEENFLFVPQLVTIWGYISRKRINDATIEFPFKCLNSVHLRGQTGGVFNFSQLWLFLLHCFAFYNILWAIGTAVISVGHGHRIDTPLAQCLKADCTAHLIPSSATAFHFLLCYFTVRYCT